MYIINSRILGGVFGMDQKPGHYDGSVQTSAQINETAIQDSFTMTDEMRKNIGRNPYSLYTNE
jgi:hypothetical protein